MGDRHLALFVPSLRGGGAERVMVTLARAFAERGHAVDLVLVRAEGPYLSEVPEGVRVVDLQAGRTLASLPALVRYLRRERPDAMLSAMDHANVVALWARRLAGVPERLVVSVHNAPIRAEVSTPKGHLVPICVQAFYQWADRIVAVSEGLAADLATMVNQPRASIEVIYNPVVTPELLRRAQEPLNHPWFHPGLPPVLLGAGRLTAQKDFRTLIRAFALVRRRRTARLIILGDGEERQSLERLARKLDVADDLELPGFVKNPFQFMARAGVFVLSSSWEGLSNVLIEALTCGASVVATDCASGPAEILEGGRWGSLVPVGDPVRLAAAICERLDAPGSEGIAARALSRFHADHVSSHYERVMGLGSALDPDRARRLS